MLRTHSQPTSAARSSTGRHRGTAGASMAEARWDRWTTGGPEDLGPHPHMTQSADDPDLGLGSALAACHMACAWEWQCVVTSINQPALMRILGVNNTLSASCTAAGWC